MWFWYDWFLIYNTRHIKRCDSGMSYGWQSDIQYTYIKDVILVCHMVDSLIYNTCHIKRCDSGMSCGWQSDIQYTSHKRCDSGMSYGWQSDIQYTSHKRCDSGMSTGWQSDIQYTYIKDVILVCHMVDSLIYNTRHIYNTRTWKMWFWYVIWLTVWYTIHVHKRCDSGMSYGWQSDIQYTYIKDVILVCHMVDSLIYNTRHIKDKRCDSGMSYGWQSDIQYMYIKDVILVCQLVDSLIYNTRT